jgi:hypothetical protein
MEWDVDLPAGTYVIVEIHDSTGEEAYTYGYTIAKGTCPKLVMNTPERLEQCVESELTWSGGLREFLSLPLLFFLRVEN